MKKPKCGKLSKAEHTYVTGEIDQLKDRFAKKVSFPIRIEVIVWHYMLLKNYDTVYVDGKKRKIKARSIGAGVYELSLKEKT